MMFPVVVHMRSGVPLSRCLCSVTKETRRLRFRKEEWMAFHSSRQRTSRRFRQPATLLPQQGVGQHDELAHDGDDGDLVGLAGGLEALEHACEILVEA